MGAEKTDTAPANAPGRDAADGGLDLGPRAVTYPYKRIERPEPTPPGGPDPYGHATGEADPAWMSIDWARHQHWIDLDGTAVNYVEIGEGRPIVFVHGLGGNWQNWLENLPYFADAGWRAVAMDLPGFGHSPMPEWDLSMPAYGHLIDEFCSRLNLHSTALVGNSMGGFICAETALDSPEWIDHLVLVSAAGIGSAGMRQEPVKAWARMVDTVSPMASKMNLEGIRRPGLRRLAFEGVFRDPGKIRAELLYEVSTQAIGTAGFRDAVVSLTGYDFLDRLGSISAPTLLIWGRDDRVVPASEAPGYVERIPDVELNVFDDCGHVPMMERPVRFNRLVASFCG